MARVLGVSAYYHDSAAVLVDGGVIVKAAQEERFSRIKNDPAFPVQSVAFCAEGLTAGDIDAVVFYEKPFLKFERLIETYLAFAPRGFSQFRRAMPVWLKEKLFQKQVIRRELAAVLDCPASEVPALWFTLHHEAHAASAFFASPFDKAVVLCLDGVGEWATTSAWAGEGSNLEPLWQLNFPHSLGLLYSAFTYYCGFEVLRGEYKLMGLAPYGKPVYADAIRQKLIDIKPDGSFRLDLDYFDYCTGDRMINDRFRQLFEGSEREPGAPITQRDMDLAASVQQVTEEIVLKLAASLKADTGAEYLCLAGGVALNCVVNGKLRRSGLYKDVWVQPAGGDAGGALGAALSGYYRHFDPPRRVVNGDGMQAGLLGRHYPDADIETALKGADVGYQKLNDDDLFAEVARRLDDGSVVGWFQGRSEFGPRALGSRSILGDARSDTMQRIMNLKIKNRESFRPFAPIVRQDDVAEYFETNAASPYMSFVESVQPAIRTTPAGHAQGVEQVNERRSSIPAVTHVDFSARIQTVTAETNPRLYRLLTVFRQRTGCGVLINTSFNVQDEPIVESPADALRCFEATGMDDLVMGNYLVSRPSHAG